MTGPWEVETRRNDKGRAWHLVRRRTNSGYAYVMEGFGDDLEWKTRKRYEAQECADKLNSRELKQ